MKIHIVLLALILAGCATTPEYDEIDRKMIDLHKRAFAAQEKGDLKSTVSLYEQCIAQKPNATDIENSRPRRWCQNNLISILSDCSNKDICDPKNALILAKELINNHYDGQTTLYFDPVYESNLAVAYASNGNYLKAVEHQDHAVNRIWQESPRLPSMREQLLGYRASLESAKP